mgnify:CR=1 FL=1
MYDIILDTLKDGIRLLPFLFVTYIVMEYIEHKMSAGTRRVCLLYTSDAADE